MKKLLHIFSLFSLLYLEEAQSNDGKSHIEQGNKLLSAGQFADALTHYHFAIEEDPSNYMTFFRRATAYLAVGKSKSALPDLDQVLVLKPDFKAARMQRASVKLKQGRLAEAEEDYRDVLQQDPSHAEASQQMSLLPNLHDAIYHSDAMASQQDLQAAIHYISIAIEVCLWDASLYEKRASYYVTLGDISRAIQDIRPTTKLIPDNTAAYLQLSLLLYDVGEADESLKEIRECLKLDSEHKQCHKHYKQVKKVVKQLNDVSQAIERGDWLACIEGAEKVRKTESNAEAILDKLESHLCTCHTEEKHVDQGLSHCNNVLTKHPDDVDALCSRADLYILDEKLEMAIEDFKAAESINGQLRKVQEGLERAQKLLKQSKKRDYYKILGVKRTANKKEISKAYRKMAQKWHPDQYKEGEEKKEAEKMFIDIAAAKEVLSNPEKREKFDQGEDPLDPEEQQGGQQWQGFNPFGHGGFGFKFHFNWGVVDGFKVFYGWFLWFDIQVRVCGFGEGMVGVFW